MTRLLSGTVEHVKRPKLKHVETGYYKGEGSQRELKTNRLKQAEIPVYITGLTVKTQEDQIQNTQESGIIQKQRTRKEQLKSADLNTLGE